MNNQQGENMDADQKKYHHLREACHTTLTPAIQPYVSAYKQVAICL